MRPPQLEECVLLVRSGKPVGVSVVALFLTFKQSAISDAFHYLHLNFGFFVIGDARGRLGNNDERLRAVGDIERALELQSLYTTLLAGIFLECGLKRFRLPMQLVCDLRRQHRNDHRHGRLDFYADLVAVVIGRESAINFQERSELVLFFHLAKPLKLGLDAVFHAVPAEVLDVNVVR